VRLEGNDVEFEWDGRVFHVVDDGIGHVDEAKMGFEMKLRFRSTVRGEMGIRRTGTRVEQLQYKPHFPNPSR